MPGGTPDAARGSGPARVSPSRRAPRVVRQQVRLLIEACWADDGRARPRASHVAEHVGSIELALTPAQRQWLDCPAGHRLPEGAPAVLCRPGAALLRRQPAPAGAGGAGGGREGRELGAVSESPELR